MALRAIKADESAESILERARSFTDFPTFESLNSASLRKLTQQEGIDFATAVLYDRFRRGSRHAEFIRRFDALLQFPSKRLDPVKAKVVIVPGALYVERPDLGGDGRLVREVAEGFGYRTEIMPLASRGAAMENALQINEWLVKQPDEKIILVSLSKGGADMKLAMAAPDAGASFRQVVAWVNVCGPLDGSHLVDWLLASRLRTSLFRMQYWLQRRDFQFVTQLRHTANGPLDVPMRLPDGMLMVSLVGFPLKRHMTSAFSRFCHQTLSPMGPNDGTISLADLNGWPGDIFPVWGMDHYFRSENSARNLVEATLRYVADEFSPRCQLAT